MTIVNLSADERSGFPSPIAVAKYFFVPDLYYASSACLLRDYFKRHPPRRTYPGMRLAHIVLADHYIKATRTERYYGEWQFFNLKNAAGSDVVVSLIRKGARGLLDEFGINGDRYSRIPRLMLRYEQSGNNGILRLIGTGDDPALALDNSLEEKIRKLSLAPQPA